MNNNIAILDVAEAILTSYEVSDIRRNPDIGEKYGYWDIGGKKEDGTFILWNVSENPYWGTDRPTRVIGKKWSDDRYPYYMIQIPFLAHTKETHAKYNVTHDVVLDASGERAFICPHAVVANVGREAIEINGNRQWINVLCSTDDATFIRKNNSGRWKKDPNNVWKKPQTVPLDVDEFLATISV